jgi:hypothetical protein
MVGPGLQPGKTYPNTTEPARSPWSLSARSQRGAQARFMGAAIGGREGRQEAVAASAIQATAHSTAPLAPGRPDFPVKIPRCTSVCPATAAARQSLRQMERPRPLRREGVVSPTAQADPPPPPPAKAGSEEPADRLGLVEDQLCFCAVCCRPMRSNCAFCSSLSEL